MKFNATAQQWRATVPTDPLVSGVCERGDWPRIRRLVRHRRGALPPPRWDRLRSARFRRSDGILYIPNASYPRVPGEPSRDDACAALRELSEVWCDFPFKSDGHGAVALAAVLTKLCRPAIRGAVPAFLFGANAPGTGKTY